MSEFSERMAEQSKRIAGRTTYWRGRGFRARRGPWECKTCGAAVIDPNQHTAFHAADKLDHLPVDTGFPEHTDILTVSVDGTGWSVGITL